MVPATMIAKNDVAHGVRRAVCVAFICISIVWVIYSGHTLSRNLTQNIGLVALVKHQSEGLPLAQAQLAWIHSATSSVEPPRFVGTAARVVALAGDQERALRLLKTVDRENYDTLMLWQLIQAYLAIGQFDDAKREAMALRVPVDTIVGWAKNAERSENHAQAAFWFELASERDGGSWTARQWLGLWWLQQRNTEKALFYLKPVASEAPHEPYAQYLLALAHRAQGELDKAIPVMEKALALRPMEPTYLKELARTHIMRGSPEDWCAVRQLIDRYLEIKPEDIEAQGWLQNAAGR